MKRPFPASTCQLLKGPVLAPTSAAVASGFSAPSPVQPSALRCQIPQQLVQQHSLFPNAISGGILSPILTTVDGCIGLLGRTTSLRDLAPGSTLSPLCPRFGPSQISQSSSATRFRVSTHVVRPGCSTGRNIKPAAQLHAPHYQQCFVPYVQV